MKSNDIYRRLGLFLLISSICVSCQKEEENPHDNATTDPRDILVGSWICDESEVGSPEVTTFTVIVSTLDGTDDGLKLYNFGLTDGNVIGYLSGDEVDIPEQSVNLIIIKGKGYIIDEDGSNWTYTIVMQGDTTHCYAGFRSF